MGFLRPPGCEACSYDEFKKHIPKVREDAIIQFLLLMKKFAHLKSEDNLWGDETEFHIVHLDKTAKRARLSLKGKEFIHNIEDKSFEAQYEFGSWMVEGVPLYPYHIKCDPEEVRKNIQNRREGLEKRLHPDEFIFTCPVFPLMGVGDFYKVRNPEYKKQHCTEVKIAMGVKTEKGMRKLSQEFEEKKQSKDPSEKDSEHKHHHHVCTATSIPDFTITSHPRHVTCARNVIIRRGEKLHMTTPIYKDMNTSFEPTEDEPYPGYIYMDSMLFAFGNCCLQQTFSTKGFHEARYLYDQLAVISPLVLALSAASPIFKGKLADIDTRWSVMAQGGDDRTASERDVNSSVFIPKSRYDSISFYISDDPAFKDDYNDYPFPVNKKAMDFAAEKAKEMGVELDKEMLQHLGFLMMRDPLVLFADQFEVDNTKTCCHFDIIQSMNWNSVRFKPPPAFDSEIPWRVELRTCELQITDEQNTAFNIFGLLMSRIIQTQKLNFYIPMSKLQENFEKAHKRDAVTKERFWFRKDFSYNSGDEYIQLSLYEFLVGKDGEYKGVMSAIEKYLSEAYKPEESKLAESCKKYITEHIIKRASGESPTIAKWTRDFVLNHPLYKKDSIVSEEIGYDLVKAIYAMTHGGDPDKTVR